MDVEWDPKSQTCIYVPYRPAATLPTFAYEPPSQSAIGREAQNFLRAMRQLANGDEGRTFLRLCEHPDYRAHYDAGYETGRHDGLELALKQRADEYGEVLKAMANGLLALAGQRQLRRALVAAFVEEILLRPMTGSAPVVAQPRYAELLAALRAPSTRQASDSSGAPPDPDDPVVEVTDMVEAAAYADSMQRLCAQLAEPAWLHPIDSLGTLIDMTVSDWIAELQMQTTSVATRALRYNCKPFDQGYVVGAWIGQAAANTFVEILETLLVIMPLPQSIPEVAILALAGGALVELEDDDEEPD